MLSLSLLYGLMMAWAYLKYVAVYERRKWGPSRNTTGLVFVFIALMVTTCFGLARPSSGHNVVRKGEKYNYMIIN
jgi:uncharacterized membrane protein